MGEYLGTVIGFKTLAYIHTYNIEYVYTTRDRCKANGGKGLPLPVGARTAGCGAVPGPASPLAPPPVSALLLPSLAPHTGAPHWRPTLSPCTFPTFAAFYVPLLSLLLLSLLLPTPPLPPLLLLLLLPGQST